MVEACAPQGGSMRADRTFNRWGLLGGCCTVNLQCPSEAQGLKAGSPACGLILKVVESAESGAWLVEVGAWKSVLEDCSCPGSGPASSASWAVLCQQLLSCQQQVPRAPAGIDGVAPTAISLWCDRLNSLRNHQPKQTFCSICCFCQAICHSNKQRN